jgi:hypothetical protein
MGDFDNCPTSCRVITGALAAGGIMDVFWPDVADFDTAIEILNASAWHNDAAVPACHWQVEDYDGIISWAGLEVVPAVGIRVPLYTINFPGRLILYGARETLRFIAPAGATVGAQAVMELIIRPLRGLHR